MSLIEEMNLKTEKEIKNTNRKKLAIKNDINNISGKEIILIDEIKIKT